MQIDGSVVFQNAIVTPGRYLLVKQLNKTDYHRMKEELIVEVVGEKD